MFFPMEVLVSQIEMATVHPGSLTEIPCCGLVTRAISMLCKKRESVGSDSYVYVKFPLGIFDYNGLKDLQNYHQYWEDKKAMEQVKDWLSNCGSIDGIDVNKIKQYFELGHKPPLTRLTGKQWVSDKEIGTLFKHLNKTFDDVICLVCTPDIYVEDDVMVKSKTFTSGKVLVALNVTQDITSKSTMIADGITKGNHWALLALNAETRCAYYGDSLGWDTPSNLGTMVKPLLQKVGIKLEAYQMVSKHFYPLQTCSDMCGVILLFMAAVLCCAWDKWLTWNSDNAPQYLVRPSYYSNNLRLNVISWIVEGKVNLDSITTDQNNHTQTSANHTVKEQCTNKAYLESSDLESNEDHSDTSDQFEEEICEMRRHIISILPSNYDYKICEIEGNELDTNNFNCTFKIKLGNEDDVREWVKDYNEITKQTMVYERNKKQAGIRVLRKLYLRCQHKQRQTGKHTKSDKMLKTTHKEHNNKNTNCPAQMVLTILAPLKQHEEFLVKVTLKHTHNHLISVADALRFRPISDKTKAKYYDLFKQGHSPSSSHLECETNLMYSDNPQLLADRNINPKLSDVYNLFNKWRKDNLGVRTGKELFTELEKRINIYNDEHRCLGGQASIQRFCKTEVKGDSQPLILAICTPLMSRVHQLVQQSGELVFIDSSSSFEDYNNPIFVISTSSAAGGLPLGVVVTSGESASTITSGMTHLKKLFPTGSFYGKGCPENIITDDSLAEREGLQDAWPESTLYLCIFHFLQSMWRWLLSNSIETHRQLLMQFVRMLKLKLI